MNYYKKHLGDYSKKAGRLTILQHGIYNLLIDACYDREKFPTEEEAIDWVWASSQEEIDGVKLVLKKFFTLAENGLYVQKRIQEELNAYKDLCENNARIANERAAKKNEALTKRERGVNGALEKDNETPPNHKPITNNHKPTTNKPNKQSEAGSLVANDRFEDFWNAYPVKKGKSKAMERWGKSNLNAIADEIIGKVGLQKNQDVDWLRGAIPHPTTYLNGERWKDEVTRARSGQAGGSASERGTQGARDWLEKRANG